MSATGFDVVAHHRTRTRRAEARADGLERHRQRLERILAVALRVATGDGRDADSLALLKAIEATLDLAETLPEHGTDPFVRLLRETDPDPSWRTP